MAANEASPLLLRNVPGPQFSAFGLFWNIVKAFAGAGTFALPWAVKKAGLWAGVGGILFIAMISNYTIKTLAKCGQKVMDDRRATNYSSRIDYPSYPEIGMAAIGRMGPILISIYSACMCFGVCVAYFTLIGSNMSEITGLNLRIIIWLAFPIASFLSIFTDMKYFSYSSVAGSAALIIAMGSVVYQGLSEHLIRPIGEYDAYHVDTFPLFLGSAAFLFLSHVIVLPLANSCGDFKRFPLVLDLSMMFVLIINIFFSVLSFMFWGQETCQNVISNLASGSTADIVRVGISLEVLASFPLVISSGFQSLEYAFPVRLNKVTAFPFLAPDSPRPFFSKNILYYVFRIVIIAGLALLASTISAFGLLISFVGSLTIAATGFVFPQIFYLQLFRNMPLWEKVIQFAIILFGIGMTVLGTVLSTLEMIESFRGDSQSTCN